MKLEELTIRDLQLINDLSSRVYLNNKILTRATQKEYDELKVIKRKIKNIALFFSEKYKSSHGQFETKVSPEANYITRGNRLSSFWSTLYKGE